MRIETGRGQSLLGRRGRTRWRRALVVLGLAVAAIAYSSFVFLGGAFSFWRIEAPLRRAGQEVSPRELLPSLAKVPGNYLRAVLDPEPVERIVLDVAFKNFTKLQEQRDEALRAGILGEENRELVPATIRHGERSIPVKIRLKGDFTDHLAGDKWSFRIQVRKNDQIFGMRRFSIQAPSTRGFQAEPIVFEHLRREGVLAPRYFFVEVTLNGKDLGLMAVEEHFSKELLESQRRREGVILHFDEEPFFRNRLLNDTFGPYSNPRVASILAFRSGSIAKSETLSASHAAATGLLRGFMTGELPASAVFDVELLARFLAVAETWRASHMLAWHNLRFYFNPDGARLEPIGFDASLQMPYIGAGLVARTHVVTAALLDDPAVRSAFVRNLERIAEEMADGSIERWVREMEGPLLRVLHRESPLVTPVDFEPLVARARSLELINEKNFVHFEPFLGHLSMKYPEPVRAYLYREGDGPRVEFVNTLPVPVTVEAVRFSGLSDGKPLEFAPEPPHALPLTLPPTRYMEEPQAVSVRFEAPAGSADFGLEGTVRVDGQDGTYGFRSMAYFPPLGANPVPTASLKDALGHHAFLRWDEAARTLRAEPGVWNVRGSLVLPDGIGLSLSPGTTLRFGPAEALIASGPLDFSGTRDEPIVLESQAKEEASLWAGIVVLRSSEPYSWEHVIVRDTAAVNRAGWQLTGGVTLRESDVTISHSIFEANRCEDALNLIRSRFVLRDTTFTDTPSDALDADFSDGTIEGGLYARIGGDAIDVSGARVTITGVRVEDARDKAISVGEGSEVTARGAVITRVGTGVASKDRSRLVLEDSELSEVANSAVMAYVKKSEYGPAEAIVINVSMKKVGRKVVAQTGSRVVLDGEPVETEDVDVDALYATGPMQK